MPPHTSGKSRQGLWTAYRTIGQSSTADILSGAGDLCGNHIRLARPSGCRTGQDAGQAAGQVRPRGEREIDAIPLA